MQTIADIRRVLKISQAEMGERLGLSQSAISRFETGEQPLDKRTLLAAQALLAEGKAA